jgi:hypothetical protein
VLGAVSTGRTPSALSIAVTRESRLLNTGLYARPLAINISILIRSRPFVVLRPFDVLNDGVAYVLTSDGKLWRERSDMRSRIEVDENVTQFQAVNDSLVYVLGTDRKLWRERGDMHSRSVVDGNVAQFQAMNDGVVYVLSSDGKLWRERSDAHNRDEVDDSVARFQALNTRSSCWSR